MPVSTNGTKFGQICVAVTESNQVGEARREALRLGELVGLNEVDCGRAAIVATELATNLIRHAGRGEIRLRRLDLEQNRGIEILAIDRGPGIEQVAQCLNDGYSTAGTAGNGLGAVKRLSTEFDIFSSQPAGTVILSRILATPSARQSKTSFAWGVVQSNALHEEVCGDSWRIAERPEELSIMVADGLGHGPLAATASELAGDVFLEYAFGPPQDLLTKTDRQLRGSRGAAMAVAQITLAPAKKLVFTGVGNISGHLRSRVETRGRGLTSHNGTVGVEMRKLQSFDYECPAQSLLIMHSDGLQTRWSLEAYPGLINRHPAIIAAVLHRDFVRGKDDVTVCVVQF